MHCYCQKWKKQIRKKRCWFLKNMGGDWEKVLTHIIYKVLTHVSFCRETYLYLILVMVLIYRNTIPYLCSRDTGGDSSPDIDFISTIADS